MPQPQRVCPMALGYGLPPLEAYQGNDTKFCCAGRAQTLRRISEAWVPELQRMEADVPILLVGCKSDLRQPGQSLQQVAVAFPSPLYEQHSNTQVYQWRCSAAEAARPERLHACCLAAASGHILAGMHAAAQPCCCCRGGMPAMPGARSAQYHETGGLVRMCCQTQLSARSWER